jgi:hypothetical protein
LSTLMFDTQQVGRGGGGDMWAINNDG